MLPPSTVYRAGDSDAQWSMFLEAACSSRWHRVVVALLLVSSSGFGQEGRQQIAHLGTCPLQNGQVILDCRIGYRTFGTLDADQANAVLMPTWLNGRSDDLVPLFGSAASAHRLVDSSKFFGVALDAFGDGVSSSPSNSPRQPGTQFPVFTIEDMVHAQYRVLTEVLHLTHAHAAIGLSMGGHQVFAWTVLYPRFLDLAVPIVGSPQITPYDLLSKQIVVDAIEADPGYQHGQYKAEPQLRLANEIGALIVAAPAYRNAETTRDQFPAWLSTIEAPQRQDANDRVWQLRAILSHDVLHGRTLAAAAQSTSARFLIIVAEQDRMVVSEPALAWARAISAPTYISPGSCAHLIMNCDAANVSGKVESFLRSPATPRH